MGVIVLIAGAAAGALIVAGLDPVLARPALAALCSLLALAAMTGKNGRVALIGLYRVHASALLAFASLLAVLIFSSIGMSEDVASRVRHAALQLFTLMLLAGAAGAAGGAYGRTRMVFSLLIACVVAALLILVGSGLDTDTPFGRIPALVSEPALGAAYGLVALLSIFAAADELRRRPAAGGRALPPLARRLFVPMAGLMTGFGMLLLSGSTSAMIAAAVGGVALAGALSLRARRSRVGMALVPAVVGVSLIAAALAAVATGAGGGLGWISSGQRESETFSPAQAALAELGERPLFGQGLDSTLRTGPEAAPTVFRWLAETGWLGVGLTLACAAALATSLMFRNDRGRPFSRGFILFSGLLGFTLTEALLSPSFDQPAPAFVLAAFTGVALSYLDFESTRRKRTTAAA